MSLRQRTQFLLKFQQVFFLVNVYRIIIFFKSLLKVLQKEYTGLF